MVSDHTKVHNNNTPPNSKAELRGSVELIILG